MTEPQLEQLLKMFPEGFILLHAKKGTDRVVLASARYDQHKGLKLYLAYLLKIFKQDKS